jgi:hypothetical protein
MKAVGPVKGLQFITQLAAMRAGGVGGGGGAVVEVIAVFWKRTAGVWVLGERGSGDNRNRGGLEV